jgi:hypothetical protein
MYNLRHSAIVYVSLMRNRATVPNMPTDLQALSSKRAAARGQKSAVFYGIIVLPVALYCLSLLLACVSNEFATAVQRLGSF